MRITTMARLLGSLMFFLPVSSRAQDAEAIARRIWTSPTGGGCFISDIGFQRSFAPNGTDRVLTIRFGNMETDTGEWHLSGNNVMISLDHYRDTFIITSTGNTMQVAHSWQEKDNNTPKTENCVLTQVQG